LRRRTGSHIISGTVRTTQVAEQSEQLTSKSDVAGQVIDYSSDDAEI